MWQKSHIAKVLGIKRAKDTQLAEKLMSEARDVAHKFVDEAIACRLLGVFDIRLVTHIAGLGKDTSDKKDWPSIGHIAEDRALAHITKPIAFPDISVHMR